MILNPLQAFVLLKKINSAQNGPTKLCFSDESSLFTVLWGLFLAQRMFFEQNKCLEWIQNHHKPLVWPLKCYLKHMYFDVFLPYTVKSMGPKLSSVITVIVGVRFWQTFGMLFSMPNTTGIHWQILSINFLGVGHFLSLDWLAYVVSGWKR